MRASVFFIAMSIAVTAIIIIRGLVAFDGLSLLAVMFVALAFIFHAVEAKGSRT